MNKSIWYISKYASIQNHGTATQTRGYYLAKELNELGYKTTVITSDSYNFGKAPNYKGNYKFDNIQSGMMFVTINTYKYKKSHSFRRILSWLDFELKLLFFPFKKLSNPDYIIVSSPSLLTILNGFILKLFSYRNSKLIFEVRDIWPLTLINEHTYTRFNPFVLGLSLIEYFGYKYSDYIIGTLPNLEEHIINKIGPCKKVGIIPNGFHNELIKITENIDRNDLPSFTSAKEFKVGYFGSFGWFWPI